MTDPLASLLPSCPRARVAFFDEGRRLLDLLPPNSATALIERSFTTLFVDQDQSEVETGSIADARATELRQFRP